MPVGIQRVGRLFAGRQDRDAHDLEGLVLRRGLIPARAALAVGRADEPGPA